MYYHHFVRVDVTAAECGTFPLLEQDSGNRKLLCLSNAWGDDDHRLCVSRQKQHVFYMFGLDLASHQNQFVLP